MTRHQGPGRRLLIGAGIAAALILVWTSAQLAGLKVHGSWPWVAFLWSLVELVRVLTGREPAAGIPVDWYEPPAVVTGPSLVRRLVRALLGPWPAPPSAASASRRRGRPLQRAAW